MAVRRPPPVYRHIASTPQKYDFSFFLIYDLFPAGAGFNARPILFRRSYISEPLSELFQINEPNRLEQSEKTTQIV